MARVNETVHTEVMYLVLLAGERVEEMVSTEVQELVILKDEGGKEVEHTAMIRSSKDVYTVVEHIVMQKVDRRMESVHTVEIVEGGWWSSPSPSQVQTPGPAPTAWAASPRR